MLKIPVKEPSPDFESFKRMLTGEEKLRRVYFVEDWIDEQVGQGVFKLLHL